MSLPNLQLILALREAANRLSNGSHYAWGNHGACNCGHLVQVVTKLSKEEILAYAQTGIGEWTELAEDYCGITDAPVNMLISKLERVGLMPSDIHNLEYLEDREVLKMLPGGFRWLQRNVREDVIVYFETYADVLEEKLADKITISFEELLQLQQPDFVSIS